MVIQLTQHTDKGIARNATYRELQKQCKAHGLKAVGKRAVLEARLERYAKGNTHDGDWPKTKKQQHAVKYRDAQRCIKYWCENIPHFTPSCKRTGWDNLKSIAQELLEADVVQRTHNTTTTEHKAMVAMLQNM